MNASLQSSAVARVPASYALPETFVEDMEPYGVYARIEILAKMRMLIEQHALATIYFNQGNRFLVSRILSIDPVLETLILDAAPDHQTNEALRTAGDLTVVSFFNHVKVQFTVNRVEPSMFQGAAALSVRMPQSILWLQRRTAFRVRTSGVNCPGVLLSPTPDYCGGTDMERLRIADISATGFAFVAPLGRPILTAGMQLPRCRIELIVNGAFDVDIEIRHVSFFKDGFGRGMCRAGCRLLKISNVAEMAIERYVHQIAIAEKNSPASI